jgi:predicted nucleotidyltransferase/HEPN domain-containing protein
MNVSVRKAGCAEEFVELLAQKLDGRLVKVVLFGSVAKGFADVSSDVDVLVVVDRISDDVRSTVAEIAFDVSVRFGEPIEYIVMGLEEYRAKSLDNPFIYEVEHFGRVLYHDPKPEEEMVKKLLRLADEYYSYAVRCAQQLMYRPAIDLSQNAVKLLLKALILAKGEALPRTHGGYIHKFGELYVLQGDVDRVIIAKLYKVLELRNKARYDPEYEPVEAEVSEVLQTYRELREIAYKIPMKKSSN